MPLYDYSCQKCGPFRDWESMSRASEPAPCPSCARDSQRLITAPFLADMDPHNRIAHHRNEKSADQPLVVHKHATEHNHAAHSHGSRRRGHKHGPSRPWMIGH